MVSVDKISFIFLPAVSRTDLVYWSSGQLAFHASNVSTRAGKPYDLVSQRNTSFHASYQGKKSFMAFQQRNGPFVFGLQLPEGSNRTKWGHGNRVTGNVIAGPQR